MLKKNRVISIIISILMILNSVITVYSDQETETATNSNNTVKFDTSKLFANNKEFQDKWQTEAQKIKDELQANKDVSKDESKDENISTSSVSTNTEEATADNFIPQLTQSEINTTLETSSITTPTISDYMNTGVTKPNYIKNDNESVSMYTGNMNYTYNILSLPGRNGLDLNLNIKYDLGSASYHNVGFWDFAQGWSFDLPYISGFKQTTLNNDYIYDDLNTSQGSYLIQQHDNPTSGSVKLDLLDDDGSPIKTDDIVVWLDNVGANQYQYQVLYSDGRKEYYEASYDASGKYIQSNSGKLVRIEDRFGDKIVFNYQDINGLYKRLNSITDSFGRIININYDSNTQITISSSAKTFAQLRLGTYTYNPQTNFQILNSITDSCGKEINFNYNYDVTPVYDSDKYDSDKWNYDYGAKWCLLSSVAYPTGRITCFIYSMCERDYKYGEVNNDPDTGNPVSLSIKTNKMITHKIGTITYLSGNSIKECQIYSFPTDNFGFIGFPNYEKQSIDSNVSVGNTNVPDNYKTKTYYSYINGLLDTTTTTDKDNLLTTITDYKYNAYDQLEEKITKLQQGSSSKTKYTEWWYYVPHKNIIKSYIDKFGNEVKYDYDNDGSTDDDRLAIYDSPYYIPLIITKKYYDAGVLKSTQVTNNTIANYQVNINCSIEHYDTNNDGVFEKDIETDYDYQTKTIGTDRITLPFGRTIYEDGIEKYREDYTYDGSNYNFVQYINRTITTNDENFNFVTRNTIQKFNYDIITGLLKSVTNQADSANPVYKITSYEYDGYGRNTLIVYPDCTFKEINYDTYLDNKGTTDTTDDIILNKVTTSNNDQYKTVNYYDGYGRILSENELDASGNEVLLNDYQYLGNQLYIKHTAKGLDMIYGYDVYDNVNEIIYQDASSNTVLKADEFSKDYYNNITTETTDKIMTTQYDNYDRPTSVWYGSDTSTISTMQYDCFGNVSSQTYPNGHTTFTYNQMGNMISTKNALNEVTSYEYDAFGNNTTVSTAGGSVTTNVFDVYGNVLKNTDALGKSQQYYYDNDGKIKKSIDKDGAITTYSYKAYTTYPVTVTTSNPITGNLTTSYTYDNLGNVLTKEDDKGGTVAYNYYPNNRLHTVTEGGKTLTYYYDTLGNITSTVDYNGATTSYDYDAMCRLTKTSPTGAASEDYTYNDLGRLETIKSNGDTEYLGYDQFMNINCHKIYDTNTNDVKMHTDYVPDLNGNQISKVENFYGDNPVTKTTGYTYDALNRLSSETEPDGTFTNYSFDKNGNISLKEVTHPSSYSYNFKQDGTDYSISNISMDNTLYAYDANNRLLNETEKISGTGTNYSGQVEAVTNYTYDDNGNMTKKEISGQIDDKVVEYSYNPLNQLEELKENGVEKANYTYYADGMRKSKTVDGVITNFYYDRGNIINEVTDSPDITATNYFGARGIYGRNTLSSGTTYMRKNAHGDVISYQNGTETKSYDYDAYGNEKGVYTNTNDANPFRYCGEYYDNESGLIYLRARYYDPGIGRFITEDPAKDGMNWYVYCAGNPVSLIDETGLAAGDPFKTIDEAAIDFAQEYYSTTKYLRMELASLLYSYNDDDGNTWYSYAIPAIGEAHFSYPSKATIPKGEVVAGIHIHPNGTIFSSTDEDWAKDNNVPFYLVTPFKLRVFEKTNEVDDNGEAIWASRDPDVCDIKDLNIRGLSIAEKIALQYFYKDYWDEHIKECFPCSVLNWPGGDQSTWNISNSYIGINYLYSIFSKRYRKDK